jgi:hypothetical protein
VTGGGAFALGKASLLVARRGARAIQVAPGKFLVSGGTSHGAIAPPELLDLVIGSKALGVPQGSRDGAVLLVIGSRVYVLGGALPAIVGDGDTLVGAALVASTLRLSSPRAFAAAVALTPEVVVILGGMDLHGALASSLAVDGTAGDIEVHAGPGLPEASSHIEASLLADGTILATGGLDSSNVLVGNCTLISRGQPVVTTSTSTAPTTSSSTAPVSTHSTVLPKTGSIVPPFTLPSP